MKYFTQGCDNLVVVSDHKPLVKIFGDRTLNKMTSTKMLRLKPGTFCDAFELLICPDPLTARQMQHPDTQRRPAISL